MCRVCFVCERCDAKNSIAQSHQVYFYLQRVLLLIEMETYRGNKIIKKKQLFSCRAKKMKHFLSEGQIYLNMANILHERNQKMFKMFTIMLKAMDIYSKLKMHLRGKARFEDDWWTDVEMDSEEDDFDDDWLHGNVIPFEYDDELSDFEEELGELFEDNKVCFYCIGEVYYREFLLVNIESLFMQIKNLCVAFTRSSMALSIKLNFELKDYCKKVRLFLHNNSRNTELRQKRSSRDDWHKYDLLEQLLARVNKHIDTLRNGTISGL
ncbi:uncharacterized protein LOC105839973 isoform X2 [Monomorium pharaonis]|uniref:uncharacterized protein LOC105839973 isoform X2 n=1 Tax=Monomorium pharaonis TaxID=307658 RepID=UPI00063FD13B|nr:uncharacterized protein LOC105839973 isoform X2 [Monomorium pharaonis]